MVTVIITDLTTKNILINRARIYIEIKSQNMAIKY